MADAQSWNTERSGSSEHDESAAGSSCKSALDWSACCHAWGEVAGRRCRRAATGTEHESHSSGVVSSSRAAARSDDTNDLRLFTERGAGFMVPGSVMGRPRDSLFDTAIARLRRRLQAIVLR